MLAGSAEYYAQQQRSLVSGFAQQFAQQLLAPTTSSSSGSKAGGGPERSGGGTADSEDLQAAVAAALQWAERAAPRKFGRVLPGEIARCREVAQRTGIVIDPIWSLAAWEAAEALASEQAAAGGGGSGRTVVMLHTGGMLGLCGLAQRYPDQF